MEIKNIKEGELYLFKSKDVENFDIYAPMSEEISLHNKVVIIYDYQETLDKMSELSKKQQSEELIAIISIDRKMTWQAFPEELEPIDEN